ncbi:MAG: DUF86 domain-containing protein [Aquificae bacterium]|nr:DUF86 domain-containing protein [Aquificota bacterium]
MKKTPKISLILESFKNLEKAYTEIKKTLSLPEEEIEKNKLLQDKLRTLFNFAFESTMRVCRHLSVVYNLKTSSRDCLQKLAKYLGLKDAEKYAKIAEFYVNYRDLKKNVPPKELIKFLKEALPLFKELARAVVEHVKKTTGNYLLIDYELLNEKASHVKSSVKKIDFVLSQGKEEFTKSPMYYDRAKYFYQVAYDALFDICKHLAPKFGVKKFGEDCLTKLVQVGVLPPEEYQTVLEMNLLKNKLISTWDVPPEELYEELKKLNPRFVPLLRHISNALKKRLSQQRSA